MKRTVYECRLCGDGKEPCRLVCIGKKKPPEGCPCGCAGWRPWDWIMVSACEVPEEESVGSAENARTTDKEEE